MPVVNQRLSFGVFAAHDICGSVVIGRLESSGVPLVISIAREDAGRHVNLGDLWVM